MSTTLFTVAAIAVIVGLVVWYDKHTAPARAARNADIAEGRRIARLREEEANRQCDAFKKNWAEEWTINEAEFKGRSALFGLRKNLTAIVVAPYKLWVDFSAGEPIEVSMAQIISAKVVRDDVRETYQRTEVVPVEIKNKKSPVGRAIVGGILLGPAGLVVGAASGLGGKSKIVTEERQVSDERIVKGPPRLIIGSSGPQGLLNISFPDESHAEHWLHQIQSARVNLGLSMV